MGRPKGSSSGTSAAGSSKGDKDKSDATPADVKVRDMLQELYKLIHEVQEERSRGEHNLTNVTKTQERMQQETKVSPYYKSKLERSI